MSLSLAAELASYLTGRMAVLGNDWEAAKYARQSLELWAGEYGPEVAHQVAQKCAVEWKAGAGQ